MRSLGFFSALALGSVAILLTGSNPANACNWRMWRSYYVEDAPIQYTYVSFSPVVTLVQPAKSVAAAKDNREQIIQASYQSIVVSPKPSFADNHRHLQKLSESGNDNFDHSGQ